MPVLLLVALLLSGCGIFSDVTDSVDDLFDRAPQFDQGTALAYAAASPPSAVASTIAGAQQPISRAPVGDRVYLQYDENLVRVQPGPGGSTVLVDDYANGYRRWAADVSPIFGAQAPTDDDGK
ncbi:DUF4247 domain-containing protein [Actinomycetospora sp. CA-101289]|uniref:DUF4247 domain-containing protein n=1 Tax=Actinomycetospora sp. CA-101289 TaxID=3239893 RepID=UPI003D983B34